jgi:tetratricopeptide (TPR) repeat protein
MASLIEGYSYDIFISYRQKDNKRNGWVTEFVENLKGELESTFKEEIGVYFDINPHDGLLETHDVATTLNEKIRCLIFIPVISRTYCDPNSFAWQNEFKAFIQNAAQDRFGLKIRTVGGNVVSRILPVIIYELDPNDRKLIEAELGGLLRGIDFVYEEQGVNRPLRADEDHPDSNLHKAYYRNQINKTANAIKEILSGIMNNLNPENDLNSGRVIHRMEPLEPGGPQTDKRQNKLIVFSMALIPVFVLLLLLFTGVIGGKNRKIVKDPDGKISIAVSNFDNLTGDSALNVWTVGIAELLIYNLGTSEELDIQSSRTMNELYRSMGQAGYSISPTVSREAAIKLNAGSYIAGNFQRSGNSIRIVAKLTDTENDNILWTGKVDGDINHDYMKLVDSLSWLLKDFLEIKALGKNIDRDFQSSYTKSADAYRKYIEGTRRFLAEDYQGSIGLFSEAFRLDSTFALAAFYAANANNIISANSDDPQYNNQAIKWTRTAHELRDGLPSDYRLWIEMWNAFLITRNANDVLKYCSLLERSDIKSRYYWYDIAVTYLSSFKMWEKAADAFSLIETINLEWAEDWKFSNFYRYYGYVLHQLGDHEKEASIYNKGLSLFPDQGWIMRGQAVCLLAAGKTDEGKAIIEEILKIIRKNGVDEKMIERNLGFLYMDAGLLDEAVKHFRTSMRLHSNDARSMFFLGDLLIKKDIEIDEGLDLIDKALHSDPDNPHFLWSKGVGFFKKGNYREALETLQHAKSTWQQISPELDKDIQEVQDAIANQ